MMGFLVGLVTTIAAIAVVSLVSLCFKPIRKRLIELWGYYGIMKGTGLRLFLPLEPFVAQRIFEKMIDEGQVEDEVLVVGRTVRWLIEKKREVFLDGIDKGLHLKILVLNPERVDSNAAELKALQFNTIKNDLAIAIPRFINICDEAKARSLKGSFEIRTCDFVVFNSLTALAQKRRGRRKVILDFSFSESLVDKYQQYYECDLSDNNHFCNKLYGLYRGVYDQSPRYIWYDAGQIHLHRGAEFVKSIISKDVDAIIQKHSGGEAIRRNDSRNFLSHMPRLFDSIRGAQPPPHPISVQLELTNRCNTRCEHCQRHEWSGAGREMPIDMVKELLRQLAHFRVQSITLSGGEPTLRPDFVSILDYARTQGLRIGVLTNGLDINDELADAITRHSDWVRVSLDAANQDKYRAVRGVDGFDKVVESIRRLQRCKTDSHRDCRIGICYSIQRLNIESVPEMVEFARGLAADENGLTFKFVHGGNGFLCDTQQLHDFRTRIRAARDQGWEPMTNVCYLERFMSSYTKEEDIADGVPLRSFYQEHETRCFTPYLFALIDAFGDVYPCCFLYHDNDSYSPFKDKRATYRMGRLSEEHFDAIWQGAKFTQIRRDLETIDASRLPECKQCTRHYLHNAVLTELLGKYEYYAREFSGGTDVFKQVLEQYPPEVVWL